MIIITDKQILSAKTDCRICVSSDCISILNDGFVYKVKFDDKKEAERAFQLIEEEIKQQSYTCQCEIFININKIKSIIEEKVMEVDNRLPDVYKVKYITFEGDFSIITNALDKLNGKCSHDRYEYFCHEAPLYIEVCDCDRATHFTLTKGSTLVIGKDGSLSYININGV